MQNILVIGGTGFIGKNLIETLVDDGHKIFLITRNKNFEQFRDNPTIKSFQAALVDTDIIKNIIIDFEIEVVFHLASNLIPSSVKSHFDRELQDVILPTFKLLNFLSERKLKIIFFSSGGTIYGDLKQERIAESSRLEPQNWYGYSKLMIETQIRFLARINCLRYIILRPSNVFGRYQRIDSKQGFIAVALGRLLNDQSVEIWGDGSSSRDYVDVSDVADAAKNIISENIEDEIFNVGSGQGHTLLEVIEILEKNLKRPANLLFKNKREVDLDKITLDITKISDKLHYNPKVLERGIKDFIASISQIRHND